MKHWKTHLIAWTIVIVGTFGFLSGHVSAHSAPTCPYGLYDYNGNCQHP